MNMELFGESLSQFSQSIQSSFNSYMSAKSRDLDNQINREKIRNQSLQWQVELKESSFKASSDKIDNYINNEFFRTSDQGGTGTFENMLANRDLVDPVKFSEQADAWYTEKMNAENIAEMASVTLDDANEYLNRNESSIRMRFDNKANSYSYLANVTRLTEDFNNYMSVQLSNPYLGWNDIISKSKQKYEEYGISKIDATGKMDADKSAEYRASLAISYSLNQAKAGIDARIQSNEFSNSEILDYAMNEVTRIGDNANIFTSESDRNKFHVLFSNGTSDYRKILSDYISSQNTIKYNEAIDKATPALDIVEEAQMNMSAINMKDLNDTLEQSLGFDFRSNKQARKVANEIIYNANNHNKQISGAYYDGKVSVDVAMKDIYGVTDDMSFSNFYRTMLNPIRDSQVALDEKNRMESEQFIQLANELMNGSEQASAEASAFDAEAGFTGTVYTIYKTNGETEKYTEEEILDSGIDIPASVNMNGTYTGFLSDGSYITTNGEAIDTLLDGNSITIPEFRIAGAIKYDSGIAEKNRLALEANEKLMETYGNEFGMQLYSMCNDPDIQNTEIESFMNYGRMNGLLTEDIIKKYNNEWYGTNGSKRNDSISLVVRNMKSYFDDYVKTLPKDDQQYIYKLAMEKGGIDIVFDNLARKNRGYEKSDAWKNDVNSLVYSLTNDKIASDLSDVISYLYENITGGGKIIDFSNITPTDLMKNYQNGNLRGLLDSDCIDAITNNLISENPYKSRQEVFDAITSYLTKGNYSKFKDYQKAHKNNPDGITKNDLNTVYYIAYVAGMEASQINNARIAIDASNMANRNSGAHTVNMAGIGKGVMNDNGYIAVCNMQGFVDVYRIPQGSDDYKSVMNGDNVLISTYDGTRSRYVGSYNLDEAKKLYMQDNYDDSLMGPYAIVNTNQWTNSDELQLVSSNEKREKYGKYKNDAEGLRAYIREDSKFTALFPNSNSVM